MIFHKSRDYYKTKASIDKAVNQKTAYKVQVYNNAKIDELVTKYNSGETVNLQPPATMLQAELSILNKPEVFKNYQRIINSKYTSNDNLFKMLTKDKASNELSRVVEAEVERIAKNVQYAEQVLKNYDIPLKMYNDFKAQQQNKSLANRQEILKQVAIKNNELLVSEGLNIPSSYSYRNLETTAENLLRQSQMLSKHEEINSINQNYIDEGKEPIYNQKEWIWTGEGATTRHASNDHQKRQVNEPFIIVNDETLDIDELMYPSDPAGSPSNTYICYCEVEYLTENGGATPVDLAEPVVPEQNILSSPVNPLGALSVLKPPKEFIDTEPIGYTLFESKNEYWLSENDGAFINENGNWEYKGLEAYASGGHNSFGKFKAEQIEAHNYEVTGKQPNYNNIKVKFDNTVKSIETKANEISDEVKVEVEQKPITSDDLKGKYYSNYEEEYTLYDFDLTEVNGKQYFNGLDVTEYYDAEHGWADIPKSVIEEYNNKLDVEPTAVNEETSTSAGADNNKTIPVDEPIKTDELMVSSDEKNYFFHKEYDADKLDIVDGEYYYKGFKLTTKENSNLVKLSMEEVEAHNNNINSATSVAVQDTKPAKEMINTNELLLSHDNKDYLFTKSNSEVDLINGEYYYKGLKLNEAQYSDVLLKLPVEDVEAHNKQFEAPVKEVIDTVKLHKDGDGDYDIDPDLYPELKKDIKFNDHTGKWEYKGLELQGNYEKDGFGYLTPADVEAHNNSLTEPTPTGNAPVKEPIMESELTFSSEDGGFLIENFKLEEIDGKYYYNGLEVPVQDPNKFYQLIPEEKVKKHNEQFATTQNNTANADGFKPIVQTDDYIHNKKSKVLKYGEDIDGQAYAVDKDGRQWVLDTKSKYEDIQDHMQKQVDMTQEYDSVHYWGHSGYSPINHFNYGKKRYEGEIYDRLRNEINPILNKIRGKANQGKSTRALENKFNQVIDKYRNMGGIRDSVFNVINEIKNIDMAMVKAPPLQQDTCFIRAGAWKLDFNKIGGVFEWEGFAGITYKNRPVDLGHESLSYNITILAPKGTRGVRLSNQFDAITSEREWLLPRGQKFKVLEFDEVNHTCTIELIVEEWS